MDCDALLAQKSFGRFVDLIAPDLTRVEFHSALDSILTDFAEHGGFIVIIAPPQHGKSERVSRLLAPFLLARNPTDRIILGSYADSLAHAHARDARRYCRSREYQTKFPRSQIARGENRSADFQNISGGGMLATGVQGGATGNPANWIVIDDPVKGREQAESPTVRAKTWTEFTASFRSRLRPNKRGVFGILITLTRWHHDDLVGRVVDVGRQNPDADQYTVYRFPAIRDSDLSDRHPLDKRAEGEALWPEQFPVREINARRAASERDFLSLYQGKPAKDSGNLFKSYQFRYWLEPGPEGTHPPQHVTIGPEKDDFLCPQIVIPERDIVGTVISCDATFKSAPGTDYVGIGVWKRSRKHQHFRVDSVNKRMGYIETKATLRKLVAQYNPSKILIEDAANGPALIEELRQEFGNDRIVPRPTGGGKVARANAVTDFFERGQVYIAHPQQAGWVHDYVQQMIAFPSAAHDDMVDETTHYLYWIVEQFGQSHWLEVMGKR